LKLEQEIRELEAKVTALEDISLDLTSENAELKVALASLREDEGYSPTMPVAVAAGVGITALGVSLALLYRRRVTRI